MTTYDVLGETITVIGHRHFLVKSHSHEDSWYAVDEEGCSCRAGDCYVDCRHLKAIRRLLGCLRSTEPTA